MKGKKFSDYHDSSSINCTTVEVLSDRVFLFYHIVCIYAGEEKGKIYCLNSIWTIKSWIKLCDNSKLTKIK